MSRPTLLRCAALLIGLVGTAFVIALTGVVLPAGSVAADQPPLTYSFPLVAWPLVRVLLP